MSNFEQLLSDYGASLPPTVRLRDEPTAAESAQRAQTVANDIELTRQAAIAQIAGGDFVFRSGVCVTSCSANIAPLFAENAVKVSRDR